MQRCEADLGRLYTKLQNLEKQRAKPQQRTFIESLEDTRVVCVVVARHGLGISLNMGRCLDMGALYISLDVSNHMYETTWKVSLRWATRLRNLIVRLASRRLRNFKNCRIGCILMFMFMFWPRAMS